ncbi:MAG: hypothetical protein NZ898_11175 [Myxococcota bacterium]|nr:hypothetical protein [Myxococcota bacterium]MDW8362275.1 acyl-CoA reductase [Myxococcales bacterium]
MRAAALALVRRARTDVRWVRALARRSGLSVPMMRWAIETTVAADAAADLEGFALRASAAIARHGGEPLPAILLVLAGNVPTAVWRAIVRPLLAGTGLLVRPSRWDAGLARWTVRALCHAEPRLAASLRLAPTPARVPHAAVVRLATRIGALAAYGSDSTLDALRARLPRGVCAHLHGHGMGAVLVQPGVAFDVERAARAIALDVAAYDQRGCLSPAFVIAGRHRGRSLAVAVAAALERIGSMLPRGPVPSPVAASLARYRDVACATGEVFCGRDHIVAYEPDAPLRATPGWRAVQVVEARNADDAFERLLGLGKTLKCVGVVGDLPRARRALPGVYCVPAGRMQTPPLDAPQDGAPPWIDAVPVALGAAGHASSP